MKYYLLFLFTFFAIVATAQDYRLEGNEVKIVKPVLFEPGQAKLKPESNEALAIIKKYLDDKLYISLLRIECHTDNAAAENTNQLLSEKRALAVCMALVKMGADCKRLLAVGFGSNKPVADNSTAEGKSANQRISFINAALRNRPIGGMPVDGGGKPAGDICTQ
jgi:OmpA-OmpF porin, OOP family